MRVPVPITLTAAAIGAALILVPTVAQAATQSAALPAPAPAPASQPPTSHPISRTSTLVLTVSSGLGAPKSHTLSCDPTGGDHPQAKVACAQLTLARGDFSHLPGDSAGYMCPMIEIPVTATAGGTWQGTPIQWSRSYPNPCWMHKATGAIFNF
jgi:hypothetical protein